jgi:hypothetical protein
VPTRLRAVRVRRCTHVTPRRNPAENGERPGKHAWPKPARPPGAARRWDDPPQIDLRALAFRSNCSHRPSCPEARRAMPLFGSVSGCPARCRRRRRRDDPGCPVPSVRRRGIDSPCASWVTSVDSIPAVSSLHPVSRLPGPTRPWLLVPTRPALASGTGARVPSGSTLRPTRPGRCFSSGWHALSGTRRSLNHAKHQVKRYFRIPRVVPRTFWLPPGFLRSSPVRRRSFTAICTARVPIVDDLRSTVDGLEAAHVDVSAPNRLNGAR